MLERVLDLKEELVDTIHFLHAKGWAPATSSNYSFRERDTGMIWISASGLDKGAFSDRDFIQISNSGKAMNDKRKTSAETRLHTMLYNLFPEAGCILHTHSVFNNVLSQTHAAEGALVFEGNELQKAIQGIDSHESTVKLPIFSNTQDMEELAERIGNQLSAPGEVHGFLLAAHGLYAWGATIGQAKRHIEAFEFLMEYQYRLKLYNPK